MNLIDNKKDIPVSRFRRMVLKRPEIWSDEHICEPTIKNISVVGMDSELVQGCECGKTYNYLRDMEMDRKVFLIQALEDYWENSLTYCGRMSPGYNVDHIRKDVIDVFGGNNLRVIEICEAYGLNK